MMNSTDVAGAVKKASSRGISSISNLN